MSTNEPSDTPFRNESYVAGKPNAEKVGWRLRSSRRLFESRWFALQQDDLVLPSGKELRFTYLEHGGCVIVVPVTELGDVVLLRSYRYPIDDWCWEVPAGGLADHPHQSPQEVAAIELREEIGAESDRLESLGSFWMSNGFARLKAHVFVALGVRLTSRTMHEPGELIDEQIQLLPLRDVPEAVLGGLVGDGDSAIALLLATQALDSTMPVRLRPRRAAPLEDSKRGVQ